MKITKRQLKLIVLEAKDLILKEQQNDPADRIISQALILFPDALVDEDGGEIYIDTGMDDQRVADMQPDWLQIWPDAMHEEGGLIYTGVMM